VPVISTFLSLLTIQYLKKNIFPTKFMPSIATIISNTSMTYFFDYVLNDVTLNVILCKFINAIKNQFAFSGTAIFFYPFNILLGFFLFSVFYTYKKNKLADLRPFIIPMFILIGFLGVIILHQNQFRYNLIITPLILVSTIFGLYKTNLHSAICKKPFLYSLIMILAFLVFIDFNLARHIYKDSYRYAITTDNHKKILPDNSRNQKVLFIFKGDDYLSYGWALYPRKILFLPLAKMSAPESYEVVQKFKPQIVLVQGMLDEDIEKVLPLKVAKLSSNPDELYKVVD